MALHVDTTLTPAVYPTQLSYQESVKLLFTSFNKSNLVSDLTTFSAFNNRYFNSSTGVEAAAWLQNHLRDIITASGTGAGVSVAAFNHSWLQSSTIARITGKSNKTIIIGAHMDSINAHAEDPVTARAPGADDNGSGSVTLIESLRVLLSDPTIAAGRGENTIEFHWYSGEEVGLLGSMQIFRDYQRRNVDVRAMLNQDMAGYVFHNRTESFGMITDNTDAALNDFMRNIIKTVSCIVP